MKKFTHRFTKSGMQYRLPVVFNFVTVKTSSGEDMVSLKQLEYPDLVEYAEAVKQSIIRKHKK